MRGHSRPLPPASVHVGGGGEGGRSPTVLPAKRISVRDFSHGLVTGGGWNGARPPNPTRPLNTWLHGQACDQVHQVRVEMWSAPGVVVAQVQPRERVEADVPRLFATMWRAHTLSIVASPPRRRGRIGFGFCNTATPRARSPLQRDGRVMRERVAPHRADAAPLLPRRHRPAQQTPTGRGCGLGCGCGGGSLTAARGGGRRPAGQQGR